MVYVCFYYALKDDQPAPTEPVRFRERDRRLIMAPVKHQLSDDFSLEPKKVKQARISSPIPSVERHMSHKGGGSGQGREREVNSSVVSRSYDLEVAPRLPMHESKRGQKRSCVSDDSLSPPPVKVNYRCTQSQQTHAQSVCVHVSVWV